MPEGNPEAYEKLAEGSKKQKLATLLELAAIILKEDDEEDDEEGEEKEKKEKGEVSDDDLMEMAK